MYRHPVAFDSSCCEGISSCLCRSSRQGNCNPAVFEPFRSSVLYSFELGSLTLVSGCPAVNRKTKASGKAPTLEFKGQGLPLYGTGGVTYSCLPTTIAAPQLSRVCSSRGFGHDSVIFGEFERACFGCSQRLIDKVAKTRVVEDLKRRGCRATW